MADWTVKRRVAVGRVSLAAASSAALVAAAFGVSTTKASGANGNENGKTNAAAVAGDANAETAEKSGKTENWDAASEKASAVELFGDLNFERGFEIVNGPKTLGVLRLPFDGENGEAEKSGKPGKLGRGGETGENGVVVAQNLTMGPESLGGETEKNGDVGAAPTWKLAQHHSKFDLSRPETRTATATEARAATPGLAVARTKTTDGAVALRLEVAADAEYDAPRRADQNWLHLLLQRDFAPSERVSFADVESLVFTCDAQVLRSERLMTEAEFNPEPARDAGVRLLRDLERRPGIARFPRFYLVRRFVFRRPLGNSNRLRRGRRRPEVDRNRQADLSTRRTTDDRRYFRGRQSVFQETGSD